jgi:hypothetical protein
VQNQEKNTPKSIVAVIPAGVKEKTTLHGQSGFLTNGLK